MESLLIPNAPKCSSKLINPTTLNPHLGKTHDGSFLASSKRKKRLYSEVDNNDNSTVNANDNNNISDNPSIILNQYQRQTSHLNIAEHSSSSLSTANPSLLYCYNSNHLLQYFISTSPLYKLISSHKYIELLKPMTESINKDWIISLQLRYAVSQLLAGAILIEQYTDILVNCIESYGRLKSTDARYKRRIATTIHLSSYPKKENKYGWMTIVQVQEDNIAIINNFELNSLLQSLADSLSTSIKDANLNAAKLLEKSLKA
ncbi:hypothetical protein BDF21DRAFT_342590 [Thamnidium elegans]|nr:hypothetical protein BDF21DRAFT_342590 [Thamnidium elegans]